MILVQVVWILQMPTVKLKNGKEVILSDREYLAEGGEGRVYVKSNLAYKVYHNPNNSIPTSKIRELSQLDKKNILKPGQKNRIYFAAIEKNAPQMGYEYSHGKNQITMFKLPRKPYINNLK